MVVKSEGALRSKYRESSGFRGESYGDTWQKLVEEKRD